MPRSEISGWVQVIIGLVGLYLTVQNGGPALDAISKLSRAGQLPPDFAGAQGVIRVFIFLLMLTTTLAMLAIGLGVLLAAVFRRLGAHMPIMASFSFIGTVFLGCLTLTLAIFEAPVWVLSGLLTGLGVVLTAMAGGYPNRNAYFITLGMGGSILVFIGMLAAGALSSGAPEPTSARAAPPVARASTPDAERERDLSQGGADTIRH